MFVTLTEGDLEQAENHGSVIVLYGSTEDGRWVQFGADARVANDLVDIVREHGEVQVEVEGWSILGIGA